MGYLFKNRLTGEYCFDNSNIMSEKNRNRYDSFGGALAAAESVLGGRQAILGLEALSQEEEKYVEDRLKSSRIAVVSSDDLMKGMKGGRF